MKTIEIVILGIGLAMDAFAVAVCKGLCMKKMNWKKAMIIALYFGVFQAIMPILGYFLGNRFDEFIIQYNHWIVFFLLGSIGTNMIKEAIDNSESNINDSINFKTMSILAIATSIDALAVGITFAALEVNLIFAVSIIGIITYIICLFGVKIGNLFGDKYEKKAQIMGGVILICLGIKILLEHLGIINF